MFSIARTVDAYVPAQSPTEISSLNVGDRFTIVMLLLAVVKFVRYH